MPPLALPALLPSTAEWRLVSNTSSFTSPLDGSVQTLERPGARWHVALSFANQTPAEYRILLAFLTSLRGQAGRFYLHDHTQPIPVGVATGAFPQVNPGFQTGNTIVTDGWTANTANILVAGDMIGIGGELKMVTANVSSVGTQATITFEPPLRKSPGVFTPVVVNKPTAIFRLVDDKQASWSVSPLLSTTHIVAEESF